MRKTGRRVGLILAWTVVWSWSATAHNLRVANVDMRNQDVGGKKVAIEFDLSWDNSWRNDLNHDAAWVFVKFRAPGSNDWQHAYLSTQAADHHADGGLIEVGTTAIGGTDYGIGVFVSSASAQTGSVSYARTRLLWDYGTSGYAFSRGEPIDLAVQAIEMVYVAEGSFNLGSGGNEGSSFTDGIWPGAGGTIPFAITNEAALTITNLPGRLWATGTIVAGELPTAFPKGYQAFYCMKYEITQGQYAAFLNLLTQAQSTARYVALYNTSRFLIQRVGEAGSYSYVAEAPDRACNFMYWVHSLAYSAWSGLRPMSELEFEKACRGPALPVLNENAWGSTTKRAIGSLVGVDGSGTETYSAGNASYSGSGPSGPVRVGIFATNDADRVSAGASYWGILELSGNLFERPVWAYGTGAGFAGTHGAGSVTLPADWPEPTGTPGFARGGAINTTALEVSTRNGTVYTHAGRNGYYGEGGFRCVRTAP